MDNHGFTDLTVNVKNENIPLQISTRNNTQAPVNGVITSRDTGAVSSAPARRSGVQTVQLHHAQVLTQNNHTHVTSSPRYEHSSIFQTRPESKPYKLLLRKLIKYNMTCCENNYVLYLCIIKADDPLAECCGHTCT